MGSFLTRALVMTFGYAYPAYECFKTVEKNETESDHHLLLWCKYWILIALLTVCERVGDPFLSWFPMYGEAKLALFIYLWYSRTKGTIYIYNSFFRPYMTKHEKEIDDKLLEVSSWTRKNAVRFWEQAASSYGQRRLFEMLRYVASQSASSPQPAHVPANKY